MRKFLFGVCAVALGAAGAVPQAASASPAHRASVRGASVRGAQSKRSDRAQLVAIPGAAALPTGPTIPFFNSTATTSGHAFALKMAGSSPTNAASSHSVINVKVIPVSWQFSNGVITDPEAALPSCAGGGTALGKFVNSPLVKNFTVGGKPRQLTEEFRREEFWKFAQPGGTNPNYSGRLNVSVLPEFHGSVNGPSTAVSCGRGGSLSMSSLDSFLKSTIIPHYGSAIKTTDFAFLLFTNTTSCNNAGCGIGGYHSAYTRNGGTQTYGVSEIATDRRFSAFVDTSAAGHEIAEWYDDPFVNNLAPSWGHIGQVSTCSTLFEVGDPLTGTLRTINGFHFQDLAEISWFYKIVPSLGVNNTFSLFGTFKSPSPGC